MMNPVFHTKGCRRLISKLNTSERDDGAPNEDDFLYGTRMISLLLNE